MKKIIWYQRRRNGGAPCPVCHAWVGSRRSLPPAFGIVIRYHYCKCGVNFKSCEEVEEDETSQTRRDVT